MIAVGRNQKRPELVVSVWAALALNRLYRSKNPVTRTVLTWNTFSRPQIDERDVRRPVGGDRFRLDGRVAVVQRVHERARERLAGLVPDDRNEPEASRQTHRPVQFRLPRHESILAAGRVDQRIRREVVAGSQRRFAASRCG